MLTKDDVHEVLCIIRTKGVWDLDYYSIPGATQVVWDAILKRRTQPVQGTPNTPEQNTYEQIKRLAQNVSNLEFKIAKMKDDQNAINQQLKVDMIAIHSFETLSSAVASHGEQLSSIEEDLAAQDENLLIQCCHLRQLNAKHEDLKKEMRDRLFSGI